ncbi:MAG: hypothetical protein ACFFDN_17845 [Candidatus Hodarchaeota archaeon]
MKPEKKFYIIFSIIISLFGLIPLLSVLFLTIYKLSTEENRFWSFIGLTSFLIFFLMIIVGGILDKKFFPSEPEMKAKKEEKPLKKKDYLILFLMFGGLIISSLIIIAFSYLSFFIPFNKFNQIAILNIQFLFIIQVIFLIGILMVLLGFFLIVIFYLRKD